MNATSTSQSYDSDVGDERGSQWLMESVSAVTNHVRDTGADDSADETSFPPQFVGCAKSKLGSVPIYPKIEIGVCPHLPTRKINRRAFRPGAGNRAPATTAIRG